MIRTFSGIFTKISNFNENFKIHCSSIQFRFPIFIFYKLGDEILQQEVQQCQVDGLNMSSRKYHKMILELKMYFDALFAESAKLALNRQAQTALRRQLEELEHLEEKQDRNDERLDSILQNAREMDEMFRQTTAAHQQTVHRMREREFQMLCEDSARCHERRRLRRREQHDELRKLQAERGNLVSSLLKEIGNSSDAMTDSFARFMDQMKAQQNEMFNSHKRYMERQVHNRERHVQTFTRMMSESI